MQKLVGVSFNGVDEKTDFTALQKLQERFPFAEFGVILSKKWYENGNRYLNPALFGGLRNRGLNLSLHLCGSIAGEAVCDNWEPAIELCNGNFDIFSRVQLNIARRASNPQQLNFEKIPENIKEVIIQQRSVEDAGLFMEYHKRTSDSRIVVLIDNSGGSWYRS